MSNQPRQLSDDEVVAIQGWLEGEPLQIKNLKGKHWVAFTPVQQMVDAFGYFFIRPDLYEYRKPPQEHVVYTCWVNQGNYTDQWLYHDPAKIPRDRNFTLITKTTISGDANSSSCEPWSFPNE